MIASNSSSGTAQLGVAVLFFSALSYNLINESDNLLVYIMRR